MKSRDLEKIKINIEKSLVCHLKDEATNIVFGKGSPDAPIIFIGEAPGDKEDKLGVPFVGSAGKKLDKYLQLIGLNLDKVYIANILKYRPPMNRDPKPDEIERHTPYLIEQIKVIKPKIIATLGNFSTKFVLSKFKVEGMKKIPGVSELHGQIIPIKIGRQEFIVVPLYHPAATMYRPKLRPVLEEDFWKMGKFLAKEIGHKLPKRVKQKTLV